MSEHYTDRELDLIFKDFAEKQDRILVQTTKTNGRVGELEKWRWIITGICIALGALSIPNIKTIITLLQ